MSDQEAAEWHVSPVHLGKRVDLADYDPDEKGGLRKSEAKMRLQANLRRMEELQELMYAEGKHALLIVLQAMDAGGKDSTIRHVMDGFNPQGCHVVGFGVPTEMELDHDFLWRVHPHAPPKGYVSIFNRSHYEDVLVVRVNELVPKKVWQARYDHINHFEKLLADSGVTILKFYLHISKDEQKVRFQERLARAEKNWKFNPSDLKTRAQWDDYMRAFEDVFARCNHPWAPWYVVPGNRKWYRNLVVSTAIIEAMEKMDMRYPPAAEGIEGIVIE
ncbi:MAG: polyphosphate kinase 2 family protein [Anaerolineae bacterium]|nr:polyphosphate kinase 2 family protein [Anaerolineae bacterium]